MTLDEQKLFEELLNKIKISFTVSDGLYFMNYQGNEDIIQTKGFNLAYCIKTLGEKTIMERILK